MFLCFILSLSELNRFTINSINRNHNNASRIALRDDTNDPWIYWLRSAGPGFDHDFAAGFRPVTDIWADGDRASGGATAPNRGFRPSLKKVAVN